MKKVLSILFIVSMAACLCVGLSGCNSASKLEKEIVGTWISPAVGEVTFYSDGSFSGTLPFEISIDIDGVYTVNSGDEIIVEFYYSDKFYDRIIDVELEGDELSLFYFMGQTGGVYTRKTDSNGEYYLEENNEYQEPEETTALSLEFAAEKNEDGVYDLLQGETIISNWHFYNVKYMLDDKSGYDKGGHLFIYGTFSEREPLEIPIFNKNLPVAIYFDADELNFIKITSDTHYAPDLNLADYNDGLGFCKSPFKIHFSAGGMNNSQYDFKNSDEIEINGEDYETFLNKRAVNFKQGWSSYYAFIEATAGEKFTIGGYKEAEWVEYDFYADVPFWYQDTYEKVTVPVEKTRNGYFTVDLSGFEPGLYYNVDKGQMLKITE